VKQVNTGSNVDARERAGLRNVLPLVALGGSLAAAPAGALELGELTVESNLGQPLRASIAYALAPSEMLSDTCVSVSAGRSTGGLPGIGRNTVSITERAIVITGADAIREPMLGTRVTINCPYTPNLSREYMLFVDPAGVAAAQATTAAPPAARPEAEPRAVPAPVVATRSQAVDTPIGQASRYQVQPGDTLSEIVRRIENRSISLWPAVNAVFAANPDAFIDNDPNKLKAGSWLTIPSFDGTAPVVAAAEPASAEPSVSEARSTTDVAQSIPGAATGVESVSSYEPAEFDAPTDAPEGSAASTDSTADLKPGDVLLESAVPAPTETIDIPDTQLEGPQTGSASPNVPTAIISTGARSESTSTLMWLVGGGLAIIAALLLFGRRVRSRFGSTPVGAEIAARDARQADAVENTAAIAGYDIDDESPTEENLALDADLEIGTGLQAGVEVDVAQDFGFAATTDLDIELPFEPLPPVTDSDTDIIPPITSNVESILESEVLPEDDDYDMSVIMDATKMPQPEDVTERDLKAVEVDALDDDADEGGFTINQETGYSLLEQDYEEELTATQALNLEIERAAAELANNLNATVDDESTAVLPEHTNVPEADEATAEMPARNSEATAEFEASYDPNDTNAVTVNMSNDDKTTEMPVANDDETVEMDIESGKVDSSKS
jgi:hypothetical protein